MKINNTLYKYMCILTGLHEERERVLNAYLVTSTMLSVKFFITSTIYGKQ